MTDEEKKEAILMHLQERLSRLIHVATLQLEKQDIKNIASFRCLMESDEEGLHLGQPSQFILELNIEPLDFIPDGRCVQVITHTGIKTPHLISDN